MLWVHKDEGESPGARETVMTNDEFKGLFGDDAAELEALGAEVAAEVAAEQPAAPKKDGVWYAHDGVDGNGHTISWYALNSGGKTLLWASVNNALEISTAPLGQAPAGVTGHGIRVYNAQRTASVETNGIAVRTLHEDGVHVDGQSVRSFLLPRVSRYISHFYGV